MPSVSSKDAHDAVAIQCATASDAAFHSPATADALRSEKRSCNVSKAASASRSAIATSFAVWAVGNSELKQAMEMSGFFQRAHASSLHD